ncbi:Cloroperoxidase, partial [Corynespora cassiicola Philippines]
MKFLSSLLASAALAAATVDFGNWHPPVAGDVRSPCPALNTLANHGILPRDGKNYTLDKLVPAFGKALNVSVETITTVALAGFRAGSDGKSFNLDDLKKHGIIEHDASLSRKDVALGGQNQDFSPEIFNEFLSYFGNQTEITIQSAAHARWNRVKTEHDRNPSFSYGPAAQFNSYVETATYFDLLKNPATGTVPVEFIKIFFSQERLPYVEGWRTPAVISGFRVANSVLQVALYTPE